MSHEIWVMGGKLSCGSTEKTTFTKSLFFEERQQQWLRSCQPFCLSANIAQLIRSLIQVNVMYMKINKDFKSQKKAKLCSLFIPSRKKLVNKIAKLSIIFILIIHVSNCSLPEDFRMEVCK